MESRSKVAGHPVHPMLIVFPVGLLSASVVFDILYLITGTEEFATVAFWAIAGGLIGGVAAAVFGLWDWLAIPERTRARRIGLMHGAGNGIVLVLFALSFVLRLNEPRYSPDLVPFVLSLAGILVVTVTAWLGGELVYRLGVGVDQGAHLDAPNSLTSEPTSRHVAS